MKIKQGDVLEIKWIDAFSQTGWWDDIDIENAIKDHENQPTLTRGVLAYENKKWWVIALSEVQNQRLAKWGLWKAIPKNWVVGVKRIK